MIEKSKLKEIEDAFQELTNRLSSPEVIASPEEYKKIAKTRADMEPLFETIRAYNSLNQDIQDVKEMLQSESDEEMKEFLRSEISRLESEFKNLEDKLKLLLIGKDPNDEKNVVMEIRAGAGGEEASLFASELHRMYSRYAERQGWKVDVLSTSLSDMGGFKEIIFEIKGRGAYSKLKFESGVHRVQRIPATESKGRIHTSTVTVAVLPEAEDVDVQIDPKDLKIDTFRSSGAGGQHVNVTDSAVRISHLPTGIVVQCQNERSQIQNREKAMVILRARLFELLSSQQEKEIAKQRKQQVGTGDRSEKIRTYNFPQGRVTDHRVGLTIYNLEMFLEGELEDMIEALAAKDRAEKLKKAI